MSKNHRLYILGSKINKRTDVAADMRRTSNKRRKSGKEISWKVLNVNNPGKSKVRRPVNTWRRTNSV